MGINICVYEIDKSKHKYPIPVSHELWDTFRYAGDKDFSVFLTEENTEIINAAILPDFDFYSRPKEFDAARRFISTLDMSEDRKEQYYKIFGIMEKDKTLYFYISY